MNRLVIITTVIIVIVLLGFGITRVGNVGIRRVKPAGTRVELSVAQPVLPGVNTVVKWDLPAETVNRAVLFEVHGQTGNIVVGQNELDNLSATVAFPCAETAPSVSLVMIEAQTEQVLASLPVTMLPAGPDCAN